MNIKNKISNGVNITQKIFTADGMTKEKLPLKILHAGCGSSKIPGSVGVDILDLPGVDVVHDLNKRWPFEDDSFDVVLSKNVLEHVDSPLFHLNEAHRVAKRIIICVPYFRCVDAFTDPTHQTFYTSDSMKYFTESLYNYTNKQWKEAGFWYGWPSPSKNPLIRLFKKFIHKYPRFYDQYLSLILPVKIVVWELQKK